MNTQTENKAENKPIFPMEKKDFIYKNTDLHGGDVPQETQVKTELNEQNIINEKMNANSKSELNYIQLIEKCPYCKREHLKTEKARAYHKDKECLRLTESDILLRKVLN